MATADKKWLVSIVVQIALGIVLTLLSILFSNLRADIAVVQTEVNAVHDEVEAARTLIQEQGTRLTRILLIDSLQQHDLNIIKATSHSHDEPVGGYERDWPKEDLP